MVGGGGGGGGGGGKGRGLPVPSLSASLHLDVKSPVVQVFQSPFPRQNSTSSLELRPFHVDSIALQEVFCELICT